MADAAIAAALRPYLAGPATPVLLAVSGGPDSTALLAAVAALRRETPVHVVTVDHGLRPDSAREAHAVAALCSEFVLPHTILAWIGPKPTHGIQAAARSARYALLSAHAAEIGARLLLTGHTRDDQAETVLMRLLAGSGPVGLAGMQRERTLSPGLRLARPFLAISKADLVAYCAARNLAFVRDPSNHDDRFARARLRQLMPTLATEGLSIERLCRLSERCARDTIALDHWARAAFAANRHTEANGRLTLAGAPLRNLPEAVLLRVLDLGLAEPGTQWANLTQVNPVRLERLERLVRDDIGPALQARRALRRTLRGALVEVTRDGDLAFSPAPPRRDSPERSA